MHTKKKQRREETKGQKVAYKKTVDEKMQQS